VQQNDGETGWRRRGETTRQQTGDVMDGKGNDERTGSNIGKGQLDIVSNIVKYRKRLTVLVNDRGNNWTTRQSRCRTVKRLNKETN